jgi:hypothetical protein
MKTSINQIKITACSIISRQKQAEERISEIEDKIKKILHTITKKNECLGLQHTRTLGHNQKTKCKTSQDGKRNCNKN